MLFGDATTCRFEEITRKFMPLPIIQFETNIVNHCNLNCKSCDHMSPIAKEWYADVAQFKSDMCRMAEIFNGEARYIRLVGGEPLLHSDITSFLTIARRYFPAASIEIWTNGLLLEKMSESFWFTCQKNAISICVTKYPIVFDYEKARDKALSFSVELKYFGDGLTVDVFNNNSFDLSGSCDPRKSFFYCQNANRHITLVQGGALYTCDKVPHINNFNQYFNIKLSQSKSDCINIYSDITAAEIFKFLTKPIPFCRYCNIELRTHEHPWARSNREIAEWSIVPK